MEGEVWFKRFIHDVHSDNKIYAPAFKCFMWWRLNIDWNAVCSYCQLMTDLFMKPKITKFTVATAYKTLNPRVLKQT